MDDRVGFIGLGVMGAPMARHIQAVLSARGAGLIITSRNREQLQAELDQGMRWADTAAEVAQHSDVVVTMVPTIDDIRAMALEPDGLVAGLTGDLLLIVSSTCSAEQMRELQRELGTASDGRITVVDAPVSGGQEGAEAGTLSIMVGGPEAASARAVEVLAPAGKAMWLGPLGAGQVAKACNQLIVAASVVANAEAAVLAERAGLDVAKLFGLLQTGYAGSRVMEVKARRFAEHDHSPSGPAKFMIKDLAAFAEEAELDGMTSFLVGPLQRVFHGLTAAGLGDLDTAVVQRYIEEHSRL